MKTIILSAFGRFGSYLANSTELVAHTVNGRMISGFRIIPIVFPCDIPKIDRGLILMETARITQSHGIIGLGMHSEKKQACVWNPVRIIWLIQSTVLQN